MLNGYKLQLTLSITFWGQRIINFRCLSIIVVVKDNN